MADLHDDEGTPDAAAGMPSESSGGRQPPDSSATGNDPTSADRPTTSDGSTSPDSSATRDDSTSPDRPTTSDGSTTPDRTATSDGPSTPDRTTTPDDHHDEPGPPVLAPFNRWWVVAGAIAIQLALGAIYAWSAFTGPLQGVIGGAADGGDIGSDYAWTKTQAQAVFSTGLAAFGLVMILAGRLMGRISPRSLALSGGLLLGLGYIVAGLGSTSFWWALFWLGLVGGSGIGLAYVVPIAVGVQWFPDRKGLLTGLAVAGFGFGAFLWILLANPPSILGISGLLTTSSVAGGEHYAASTVQGVFVGYGVAFALLVGLGSLAMVSPPEGWRPEGWVAPAGQGAADGVDSAVMLRSWAFYALWGMFAAGALAGLMVIGNIQSFAKDLGDGFQGQGYSAEQAADWAVIGAAVCLPILNGSGRIVWGLWSDRIGRRRAFMAMFAAQALAMTLFFWSTEHPALFFVAASLIGFNFGGNFALFPAATADLWGARHVGANYGLVFTSYAAGGLVGPLLAGWVQDAGLAFTWAFLPAAALCLLAVALASILPLDRPAGLLDELEVPPTSLGLRSPGPIASLAMPAEHVLTRA